CLGFWANTCGVRSTKRVSGRNISSKARRGRPQRGDFSSHRHPALGYCWSMIFSGGKSMPIADSVVLGSGVRIPQPDLVNLYGCTIGAESRVGAFVEIQKNAHIGARCKISSHTFICEGVTVEDDCFIGHHVCFINDRFPRATSSNGLLQTEADWQVVSTRVSRGASIGSGAVIL